MIVYDVNNNEAERIFALEHELENKSGFMDLYFELGKLYEKKFDYDHARGVYLKGIEKAKEKKDNFSYRKLSYMLLDLIVD